MQRMCLMSLMRYFFDIPLEQVCLPGLHITIGVYLKLFKLFELFAKETDSKIAGVLALENNEISNEEFQAFVNSVKRRNRLNEEVAELKQQRDHILEEINWFAITNDNYFDPNRHDELLQEVDNVIAKK